MKTTTLKTDITCSGCLSKVTPYLDEALGEDNSDVDLQSPQKTLTIMGANGEKDKAKKALEEAGYNAEEIK
ncbi:hypothetical protein BH23BAC3_BH23BAC3_31460 [soil metagenome]